MRRGRPTKIGSVRAFYAFIYSQSSQLQLVDTISACRRSARMHKQILTFLLALACLPALAQSVRLQTVAFADGDTNTVVTVPLGSVVKLSLIAGISGVKYNDRQLSIHRADPPAYFAGPATLSIGGFPSVVRVETIIKYPAVTTLMPGGQTTVLNVPEGQVLRALYLPNIGATVTLGTGDNAVTFELQEPYGDIAGPLQVTFRNGDTVSQPFTYALLPNKPRKLQ
jgi:hypothetical protein